MELIVQLLSLFAFHHYLECADVSVYLSTQNRTLLLTKQNDIQFHQARGPYNTVIDVDENASFQTMTGFGASLTESSAWLISEKMSESQREDLLQQLFSPTRGIGLNVLRQPMGASDFSLSNYSYDDTCCDLDDFSIEHDRQYIIPLLKRIKTINPELEIIGTPWSPPGWMKSSNSMVKGKLKKEYYGAYASYFVKFIEDYEDEGLPIYAVTIQNEPRHEPCCYPGMLMDPDEQSEFIKNYLGPEFDRNDIDTKILVWDHNWDGSDYPARLLGNKDVSRYVAGTAYHCYGGKVSAQTKTHNAYPDKDVWQTECSAGGWIDNGRYETIFKGVVSDEVIGSVRNWARGVLKWNLALDENHGPTNGGCNNCHGVVKIKTRNGSYKKDAQYHALGHASKFVRKGATRIQSTHMDGSLESVAFKNPDGSKILVVLNNKDQTETFTVRYGTDMFTYSLDPGSVVTFTWTKTGGPRSAFDQIEAESFSFGENVDTESCEDTSGCGANVAYTSASSRLVFKNVDFGDGARMLSIRVATDDDNSGSIEFHADSKTGPLIASIPVSKTGGWQEYETRSSSVSGISGVHDVYVIYNMIANLNWFRFDQDKQDTQDKQDNQVYRIESKMSGKSLDIRERGRNAGAQLQQWDYVSGDNQKFQIEKFDMEYFKIRDQNSKKILEVPNGSRDDGAMVQLGNDGSAYHKQWLIQDAENGFKKIVNRQSGKSMDVKDRSMENGGDIQQWSYYGSDNQLWKVVKA